MGLTSVLVFCPSAVTFVPVSTATGRAEADDILAAVRPATCLVTVMLANNETGVIMVHPWWQGGPGCAGLASQRGPFSPALVLCHLFGPPLLTSPGFFPSVFIKPRQSPELCFSPFSPSLTSAGDLQP